MHYTNNFSCHKNFLARVTSKNICLLWYLFSNYYPTCTLCKRMGEEPIPETKATKMKGQWTFCFYCCVDEGTIRICFAVVLKNKTKRKNVDSLLFLSTLRRWVFSWALSRKLITWAKCLTLTILAKTSGKIGKCFAFAMSNLRENIFSRLSHFLTFLLFVFVKK